MNPRRGSMKGRRSPRRTRGVDRQFCRRKAQRALVERRPIGVREAMLQPLAAGVAGTAEASGPPDGEVAVETPSRVADQVRADAADHERRAERRVPLTRRIAPGAKRGGAIRGASGYGGAYTPGPSPLPRLGAPRSLRPAGPRGAAGHWGIPRSRSINRPSRGSRGRSRSSARSEESERPTSPVSRATRKSAA